MSKKIYIIWGLFIVVLVGCFLYIALKTDDKYKEYYSLENNLAEAASIYMSENILELSDGESLKLKIEDLVKADYIDSKDTKHDKCDGYVLITKKDGKYSYKTYLTCEYYKTLKN